VAPIGYAGQVTALFQAQNAIMMLATLALFVLQGWAFVDAVSHRPEAYVAADKLTKTAWLIILGIALVAHMMNWSPFSILNLIGAVAAIVYLVDARPALRELTRRR
jgi:cytochrome bd-type quinol oxidase subunit 2